MKGRPTKYSPKIADKICEEIASSSNSLHKIAKKNNIAINSILLWLTKHEEFSRQYARAKVLQADFMASEIIEISDDGSNDLMTIERGDTSYEQENKEVTSRSKLRVDARKWLASKLAPKKYGDKLDVTTDGDKINQKQVFKIGDTIIEF